MQIGSQVYGTSGEDAAVLEVFPRLINQLIVEIMRPDAPKSEAIATFEAMCNFWRTLRFLIDGRGSLRSKVGKMLSQFVSCEAQRHKEVAPDLGIVLVLFTAYQGHEGCPKRKDFVDAYLDENSLRWVMWWQKSGTPQQSGPVFEATKVSREICMFQLLVLDVVIGKVSDALSEIESSNCKLPERLETLQAQWREMKLSTDSWGKYFENIGASRPSFDSTDAWIGNSVERAAAKGPRYGSAGGKGQGKGKDKGKGKGGKGGNKSSK